VGSAAVKAGLALLLLLPGSVFGAEPAILSWPDCVSLAMRQNPALAASRRSLEAGQASYKGSYNGFLPQVSLTNSYRESDSSGSGTLRWSAGAQASLNLWDMDRFAAIKASRASLSSAEAGLRQASSALRFNLRRAFAQLLFAQQNVQVSGMIRDLRRNDAQMVQLRYESGRESKGNMLRANAQAEQAAADLAQAERDLRAAQRALDAQLGIDDFSVVAATGALEAPGAPAYPEQMAALTVLRPDVAAQEAAVKSARASLLSARSGLSPKLSLNYGRSFSDTSEFPNGNPAWTFGGTLSLPIFGDGPTATYFSSTAAKRKLEKAEQDLRTVRNAARIDLEDSWAEFAGAGDQVRVQAALLEAARQRNDEEDVRYASGLVSFDNWERVVSDRVGAERQALASRRSAVTAMAGWERSLGIGLEE